MRLYVCLLAIAPEMPPRPRASRRWRSQALTLVQIPPSQPAHVQCNPQHHLGINQPFPYGGLVPTAPCFQPKLPLVLELRIRGRRGTRVKQVQPARGREPIRRMAGAGPGKAWVANGPNNQYSALGSAFKAGGPVATSRSERLAHTVIVFLI
jgi:hypothetical protein